MTADDHHRFVLSWAGGAARLALPARNGSGDVHAARALAPALPALQALQRWLGVAFDSVEPLRADAAGSTDAPLWPLDLAALGAAGPATLVMPVAAWPFGRAVPAELQPDWPHWRCRAVLQRLAPGRLVASRLRPGALLLLPDAFAPGPAWPLRLRADAAPAGWPELELPAWQPSLDVLALDAARPAPPPPAADAAPDATECDWRVALEMPLLLSAAAWFAAGGVLHLPPTAATLWQGARPAAHGDLVPAGAGWALRLTGLAARAQDASRPESLAA